MKTGFRFLDVTQAAPNAVLPAPRSLASSTRAALPALLGGGKEQEESYMQETFVEYGALAPQSAVRGPAPSGSSIETHAPLQT